MSTSLNRAWGLGERTIMCLLVVLKHGVKTHSLRSPLWKSAVYIVFFPLWAQVIMLSPVEGLQIRKLSSMWRQYGFCPHVGTLSRSSTSKPTSHLLAPVQSSCLPATRGLQHILCLISVFSQLCDALFNFHFLVCPFVLIFICTVPFSFLFLINHPSESLLKSG